MIHLHVLGTVELVGEDGQPVSSILTQPKRLGLLAYLATAQPAGFYRRDTLVGLFWPEHEESRARKALAQSVYWIRLALGRDLIRARGNELAVAHDRLQCDAVDLWRALDENRVNEAVKLYRGRLLPGLFVEGAPAFEEWLERERDRQRRAVLDAVAVRSAQLEREDPAAAAALLRRALEIAPEDESALRRLLRILDARGDRADALATYDAFARRLAVELEIEPAPETTTLRDAIAARATLHDPAARLPGTTLNPVSAPAGGTPGPISAPAGGMPGPISAPAGGTPGPAMDRGAQPEAASSPASPPGRTDRPDGRHVSNASRGGTSRRRYRNAAAGAVALVVFGTGAILTTRRSSPEPATALGGAGSRIVVTPFTAAADTGLHRLGRDLVVTLSASLVGMGGLDATDAHTVLRRAPVPAEPATAEGAVAFAKSVGADRVLRGTLVRDGPGLRADMAIHDVASGRLIARTTVRTPFRDVSTVTDSLALAVLRSLWDRDPAITRTPGASRASPGPAALATRSLPALRAFLAGEQAIAEVRGDEAAAHFARAFALDSTYWFAYWRYAQIRSAWHAPVEPHVRASYEAHRHSFPERDRLLIEARMSSPLSDRLARTRAVTQRFQDFALAWFEYANLLVHDGPFLGTTRADAREALDRALALTPADLVVLQHLFWIAAAEGDTATSGFVLRRIRDVRAATPGFIAPQPDELDLFVLVDALARSDGDPIPAVGAIERAVAPFIDYRGSIPLERVTMGLSMYGFHRAQIAIGEQFLAADVPRTLKAGQMGAIAMAWAGRGAWDSAIAAGARAYRAFPDAKAALRMLRLATAAEWLGALPAGTADQWSATLKIRDDQFDAFSRFEVVWLDGVRAAARGDRTGLTDARQRLAGPNAGDGSLPEAPADVLSDTILERSVPRMLATSLAAFERALAGDATGAADLMVDLERERADQWWTKMYGNMHPLLTAVNRITAARWLRETGRAGEAATLLRWHEAVQVPAQLAADIDAMLDAIIFFERARTAEALGRINDARRFDREFLRRYDMPVPAHRHLVERLGFPTQS